MTSRIVGYEFEVAGEVIKEHECPICLYLIRNAMSLPCSHVFCFYCIQGWEESAQNEETEGLCPACKLPYDIDEIQPLPYLDRIITNSLKVKCKQNQNKECNWIGVISDYERHVLNDCIFTMCECSYEACELNLIRRDLPAHQEVCEYRPVNCQYCNIELVYKNMEEHFEECESYPNMCPNEECDETPERSETENHRKECQYEVVPCDYHTMGCTAKMRRMDLKKHIEIAANTHMSLLLRSNEKLTNALASALQILDTTQKDLQETKEKLQKSEEVLKHFVATQEEFDTQHNAKVAEIKEHITEGISDLHSRTLALAKDFKRSITSVPLLTLSETAFQSVSECLETLSDKDHQEGLEEFKNLMAEESLKFETVDLKGDRFFKLIADARREFINNKIIPRLFPDSYHARYNRLESLMKPYTYYKCNDGKLLFKIEYGKHKQFNGRIILEHRPAEQLHDIWYFKKCIVNKSHMVAFLIADGSYDTHIILPTEWSDRTDAYIISKNAGKYMSGLTDSKKKSWEFRALNYQVPESHVLFLIC